MIHARKGVFKMIKIRFRIYFPRKLLKMEIIARNNDFVERAQMKSDQNKESIWTILFFDQNSFILSSIVDHRN